MVRVYADIVGDLFHAGHVNFLREARALGDQLVVGVLSDDDVASYKRVPLLSLQERVTMVAACRYVDEVVAGSPLQPDLDFIRAQRIDLVVHGDDFDPATLDFFYRVPMQMGIFRTVPYTRGISTTEIMRRLMDRFRGELREESFG